MQTETAAPAKDANMETKMESAKLKQAHEKAVEYIAKIGKSEPHFRDQGGGKLSSLKVETRICHQASPSDQNYWSHAEFDVALCRVIRTNFPVLSKEALELMRADYEEKRISEKSALLAQLAEIEALEASRGV